MKTLTRTLLLLLTIGIAAPALAQTPPRPPRPPRPPQPEARHQETARQTLHVPNVTELELANISGDIVITAASGRDARVEVLKRGYGDTPEEAREQLSFLDVRLMVSEHGRGRVSATYQKGGTRRRNLRSSADYTVSAPAGTIIHVHTVSGDIAVRKITGELSLESVSGGVTVDAPGRVSIAKSVSGDVRITGAAVEGPLTASSVSGTVRLEGLKAPRVEASSVSGDVVLRNVACERVSVETVSGRLEYSGAIAPNGRYELQGHSGDIRFAAGGNVGFEVEASSFSGDIRTSLPITNLAAGTEADGAGRRGVLRSSSFRGTYGDGSATVELSTFSGDIVITKQGSPDQGRRR